MQKPPLPILPCETQGPLASQTSQLIREWLFRFGVEYKEDVAPRLPLWLEVFGGMDPEVLERLFSRALKTCKFFPKISEILEQVERAEQLADEEAAEIAWQQILELRRTSYNPDIPQYLDRELAKLPERTRRAAIAAGVFRDHESVESLHVWCKKRFIESFLAWSERKQNEFLLPSGEMRDLIEKSAQKLLLDSPNKKK